MATKAQATFLLNTAIRPALQGIRLWTPAAEELILGTAIVESDLIHRMQLVGGPARGVFQMEPATHDDIWNNFLKYKPDLALAISSLMTFPDANKLLELERNDKYASAMARAHYLRAPKPLPKAGDVNAMAKYWKVYYNTWRGKGDADKYRTKWNQTMGVK
jgi:hypothetical protein